jgi:hypothetical protein
MRAVAASTRPCATRSSARCGRAESGRVYSYARGDNPEGLRAAARHQKDAGTVRYLNLFGSRRFRFGIDRTSVAPLLR